MQEDNEKIANSLIKMHQKFIKQSNLQGNLIIYAALDQFSF